MKIAQNNLGLLKIFLVVIVCGLPCFAVESPFPAGSGEPPSVQALIVELESHSPITSFDCSHFVHALYDRVGLHYQYADSRTLYRGIEEFHRVQQPQSGDLVVWRGHTGIVVDPLQNRFMSALRTGVKTSSYVSSYWKRLGPPRFFRFIFSADKTKVLNREDKSSPDLVLPGASEDN